MEEDLTAEQIEQRLPEIERLPGGFYTDRATPLAKLARASAKLGNKERADQLQMEAAAFLLTPRGKTFPGYFQPAFVYTNGTTSPARDFFTQERLKWLAKRATGTKTPAHAAHLADVCWDLAPKKDPALARLASDKYFECAQLYWAAGSGTDFGDAIKRAAELAATVRDYARVSAITVYALARLNDLDGRKEYRYCLDLADALENAQQAAPADADQRRVLEILSSGAVYYQQEHSKTERSFGPVSGPNERMSRSFTEMKLALARAWKRQDVTADATKLEKAQSYEREAARAPSALAKLVFLQDAEKLYGELGKTADQTRIRIAMGESGKAAEAEFKPVRGGVQIPHAEIDEYIGPLIGADLAESLRNFSAAPHFIPDLDSSRKSAAEGSKKFPLQAIVPKIVLKDGHVVGKASTEEELLEFAVIRDFVMGINIAGVFRSRLFERLGKEQGLSRDGLVAHFRGWGYCKDKHLEFLDSGLRHYFEDNYTSALHVLVPQFEDMLRGFLEKAGQSIGDPQRGKFLLLDSLLKNKMLVDVAGVNLVTWYRLSLSDPDGVNLRNDIAHGLSSPSVMTKETTELVIHLLLSLTRFNLDEKPPKAAD